MAAHRARRARLIAFLTNVADERQFRIRVGDARVGYDVLSDSVLEELADRAKDEFWRRRERNRESQAAYAAHQASRTDWAWHRIQAA